ncbi:glycerol-3-phosphate dehydrogenase/oxidase [Alkalicoccobacillus porphyridii]|uniref:Aerobic glycerol-3-phosphate dehydrogenase n=1 Tax=Alkalicoccobacillus porphyridii TaxID=2597270 RepID=A0A553ZUV0_9BACI|nr:FAD-dependent oxidoreductase [Alkalicoccobacillus porphyridii]TSB45261.1 glycerol-3-phosphate dehydrogenase/oxidase [Alkalicoccobacillus porphyridii]
MGFSYEQRINNVENMANEELDLLVIGGGITGAGIGLDASDRGLRTGLIEMQDFAAGTSSRSTKLIHGGLRYLKQFEIKLVADVGKERAIVYENAPHVTTPLWMMLPFYKGGTFNYVTTSLGLKVYDFLAGVKKEERRNMLKTENAIAKEPLLNKEGLKGAGLYVEYRTDDARLTIEVMKKAEEKGLLVSNYVKAENFLYKDKKVVGVQVTDLITGKKTDIYAKKIVNATGPWVDLLREKDNSKKGKTIHLTKGVHLVVSGKRFPLKSALYFDTPFKDGRMMFAIPREGKTYIGTTDTNYKGDQAEPGVTKEDADYILRAANGMFPELDLHAEDVESSWSGLRPLIHEEGKDPSDISRKDEIFRSESGLFTIAGGKLTGYRKMADSVVSMVTKELSGDYPDCNTEKMLLSGGDVGGSHQFETFVKEQSEKGMELGLNEGEATELVHRYGSNIEQVFEYVKEADESEMPRYLYASLRYALEHEMTATPLDFFVRRTGYLYFHIDKVLAYKSTVMNEMEKQLGWSPEQTQQFTSELDKQIEAVSFKHSV